MTLPNTELLMQTVLAPVAEVVGADSALRTNPDLTAAFPVTTVQPPIQTPLYMGAAWHLVFTVEVWAATQSEAAAVFDKIRCKLAALNLWHNGNTPLMYDKITKKYRFGGYFEGRWNAVCNTLERSI